LKIANIESTVNNETKQINDATLEGQKLTDKIASFIPDQNLIAKSLESNTKVMTNLDKLIMNAKQGNPVSQHNLSTIYSLGSIVSKDNKKAFMLMQESANQGLVQSQNGLAMMYLNGIGIETDYEKAHFWASASARKGDQEGKQILRYLISRLK